MQVFWARLASFGHLCLISDPLIISKFSNESHDPKGQENKIYTIVKDTETFYRRHTVPITSCSEIKYVLKKVMYGMKLSLNQVWDRTAALTGVSRSTAQKIVEEKKKVNYWKVTSRGIRCLNLWLYIWIQTMMTSRQTQQARTRMKFENS